MDRLLRGAINDLVVTPGQSVTTSGMRSRFRPQVVHLRQFAAVLQDGSVIACGDRYWGGRGFRVRAQCKNLYPFQQIQAGCSAFAATLSDGSDETWGDQDWLDRAKSSEPSEKLGW